MKRLDILEDRKTRKLYEITVAPSEYNNWRATVRELATGMHYAVSTFGYCYLLELTLVPFSGAKVLTLEIKK